MNRPKRTALLFPGLTFFASPDGNRGLLRASIFWGNKKSPSSNQRRRALKNPGGVLLSHTVAHAVPSALEGLTSVFGMGTGVTPPLSPPKTEKQ
jgi:hypothetical protein